jgi:predicted nucleic acid-binding protein
MIGIDTNIFAYARIATAPMHKAALAFLDSIADSPDIVVSELVLTEFYLLLRNEKILETPLSAAEAAAECQIFRAHPRWQLVDSAEVMNEVWGRLRQVKDSRDGGFLMFGSPKPCKHTESRNSLRQMFGILNIWVSRGFGTPYRPLQGNSKVGFSFAKKFVFPKFSPNPAELTTEDTESTEGK